MSTLAHPPQTARLRFPYSESDDDDGDDDETLTVEDLEVESSQSFNDKSDEWMPKKKSGKLQIKISSKLGDLT